MDNRITEFPFDKCSKAWGFLLMGMLRLHYDSKSNHYRIFSTEEDYPFFFFFLWMDLDPLNFLLHHQIVTNLEWFMLCLY